MIGPLHLDQHHTGWVVFEIWRYGKLTECHASPINDTKPHENCEDCWCGPASDDGFVWVHVSADRREEYEQGKRSAN